MRVGDGSGCRFLSTRAVKASAFAGGGEMSEKSKVDQFDCMWPISASGCRNKFPSSLFELNGDESKPHPNIPEIRRWDQMGAMSEF